MYCLQVEQLDRTRRKESMRKRLPAKRNESVILGSTDAKFYFSSGLLEHSQLGICRLFHNEGRAGGGKGKTYFAISSLLFFYPLLWIQACPEGMCTNGLRYHARCHHYPNPVPRAFPGDEVDHFPIPQPVNVGHTTEVYVPYSFRTVV